MGWGDWQESPSEWPQQHGFGGSYGDSRGGHASWSEDVRDENSDGRADDWWGKSSWDQNADRNSDGGGPQKWVDWSRRGPDADGAAADDYNGGGWSRRGGASERLERSDLRGFDGRRVQFVQIGLGTFATFIQNLAGTRDEWDAVVAWLLEAVSDADPSRIEAVAVEPVGEHVQRLRKLCDAGLPHVRLVQVAVGEEEADSAPLSVLTWERHQELMEKAPAHLRKDLEMDLLYLRNMSSVDTDHPRFWMSQQKLWRNYGIELAPLQRVSTPMWTYARLSRELDFCGCEVLLIDAEGHDAKILRSMLAHCKEEATRGRDAWPTIIVFESAGHCDEKEGGRAEAMTIRLLETYGYDVFLANRLNTNMVRRRGLDESPRLRAWFDKVFCEKCWQTYIWPMRNDEGPVYCRQCYGEWIRR